MALGPGDRNPLVHRVAGDSGDRSGRLIRPFTAGSSRKQTQLRQAQHPIDSNTNQYGVYTPSISPLRVPAFAPGQCSPRSRYVFRPIVGKMNTRWLRFGEHRGLRNGILESPCLKDTIRLVYSESNSTMRNRKIRWTSTPILERRERIKRKTMEMRRRLHHKLAASASTGMDQSLS
jgi:hypothetical protein